MKANKVSCSLAASLKAYRSNEPTSSSSCTSSWSPGTHRSILFVLKKERKKGKKISVFKISSFLPCLCMNSAGFVFYRRANIDKSQISFLDHSVLACQPCSLSACLFLHLGNMCVRVCVCVWLIELGACFFFFLFFFKNVTLKLAR